MMQSRVERHQSDRRSLWSPVLRAWRSAAFALAGVACPASAAIAVTPITPPDYRDDRSTPEAVISSLYNAVARHEYTRAWSYFDDGPDRPDFATFAKGYEDTAAVSLKLGKGTSEGAAGSIYALVPVVVQSMVTGGERTVYAGCYQLKQVQPAAQIEPPFHPLGIVKGRLEKTNASFEEATGHCPKDGL
ncbi:hypothetical protein [Mangrovicella endophytica]|uniref:hypothetical protein n=1 Tax=Mangrovicella endophytica TaxID=2066697 RepID=UPI000C9DB962|nr:hypothetical protein [Mangrovicella endophytica]